MPGETKEGRKELKGKRDISPYSHANMESRRRGEMNRGSAASTARGSAVGGRRLSSGYIAVPVVGCFAGKRPPSPSSRAR